MNKKELWEVFMKTGSVADYLRYRKAAGYTDEQESPWEEQAEIAEEFSGEYPYNDD